jgi:hypothetical protein
MDRMRYGIFALFVGISSCAGGREDTIVSAGTPPVPPPHAVEPGAAADARSPTSAPAFEASVAEDGATYATWDDHDTTIVRSSDHAAVVVAGTPSEIRWSDRYVTWSSIDAFHIVERTTMKHLSIEGGGIVIPKTGNTIVTWNALRDPRRGENDERDAVGVVEVRDGIDAAPRIHIVAASVSSPVIDANGRTVAWTETPIDVERAAWIHTVDVITGAHARFEGKGAPCDLGKETIDRVEGTTVRTEDTCHPGCPSLEYTPSYVEYDAPSGRVVARYVGPTEPPTVDVDADL